MTSVSAGHIIQTPTQPVGSGRPQWGSNPGPPHQESRALPQSYRAPPPPQKRFHKKNQTDIKNKTPSHGNALISLSTSNYSRFFAPSCTFLFLCCCFFYYFCCCAQCCCLFLFPFIAFFVLFYFSFLVEGGLGVYRDNFSL